MNDGTEPIVTVETITPDMAAKWLVGNTHNRNVKTKAVEKYAEDMALGQWDLNGESIKFNGDGRLLDGQNRLLAVIQSKSTIRSVVVRGLAAEGQDTMDIGVSRRLSDVLTLRGEVNCIDLAAGVVSLWRWTQDPSDSSFTGGPSVHQALAFLAEHPNLRSSVTEAERVRKAIGLRGSIGIALHYITSSIDASDAEKFWERLVSGTNLSADDSIYLLRNALLADRSSAGKLSQRMSRAKNWALCVKAWNAYREGRPVKLLVWRPGGSNPEAFPVPA